MVIIYHSKKCLEDKIVKQYYNKYTTFYTRKQANKKPVGYSDSPMKPFLLMKKIKEMDLSYLFQINNNFPPFQDSDFQIAHTEDYIKNFFYDESETVRSNGLLRTEEFASTIRFTNSSLYHAQKYAVESPSCITFSPTSGFHHATPLRGSAFCTFSGQVISAVKLYREKGIRTAWIDMDGHRGNSIEDSRRFVPDLNDAIPVGMNLNPVRSTNLEYLEDLDMGLERIAEEVLAGRIHSICFAQGADSHEWDRLSFDDTSLSTEDWIKAHQMVFESVKTMSQQANKHIPLTISLFGGYREDDYDSVLNLHLGTLISGMEILSGVKPKYKLKDDPYQEKIFLV